MVFEFFHALFHISAKTFLSFAACTVEVNYQLAIS